MAPVRKTLFLLSEKGRLEKSKRDSQRVGYIQAGI